MNAQLPDGWEAALKVPQLASVLGCGTARVYEGCKHEGWPHMRANRTATSPIRFAPEDVAEIKQLMRENAAAVVGTPTNAPALASASALARGMARRAA